MKHIYKLIALTSMLFIAGQSLGAQLQVAGAREDFNLLANLLDKRKSNKSPYAYTFIDMKFAQLPGAQLKHADLQKSDFKYANFQGADLSYADLSGTDFTGANLHNANLDFAIVHGAIFTKAQGLSEELKDRLSFNGGAIIQDDADKKSQAERALPLPRQVFATPALEELMHLLEKRKRYPSRPIIMPNVDLSGINLAGVNLRKADLRDANLSGTDLTGADLTESNLTRARLESTILTNANLTKATLTGAILTRANLTQATLTGVIGLMQAHVRRAIFTNAKGLSDLNQQYLYGKGALQFADQIPTRALQLEDQMRSPWYRYIREISPLKKQGRFYNCIRNLARNTERVEVTPLTPVVEPIVEHGLLPVVEDID